MNKNQQKSSLGPTVQKTPNAYFDEHVTRGKDGELTPGSAVLNGINVATPLLTPTLTISDTPFMEAPIIAQP
jgi:hypothetical protein